MAQDGRRATTPRMPGSAQPQLDPYHIGARGRYPRPSTSEAPVSSGMTSITEGQPLDSSYTRTSSSQTASSTTANESSTDTHGRVRTLPVWIESFEGGDREAMRAKILPSLLGPKLPPQAFTAQHHHSTSKQSPPRRMSQDGYESDEDASDPARQEHHGMFGTSTPVRGRKWDHARSADPVVVSRGSHVQTPWVVNLVKSSMYGPQPGEDREVVSNDFLDSQTPGYFKPWRGDIEDDEKGLGLLQSSRRRKYWYQRAQHTLLMHPLVPLAFRLTVLITSVIALSLACSIYRTRQNSAFPHTASTVMAIVVDTIAIPYILYITWDEYTGKPLGLRAPRAKMRLVLLDLFFIIFESANLAIAFSALDDDTGSCRAGENGVNAFLCQRTKALVSFLFVALVAWDLTFVVSIFRLVERVGGKEEDEQ